jgi:hypothetical protein
MAPLMVENAKEGERMMSVIRTLCGDDVAQSDFDRLILVLE